MATDSTTIWEQLCARSILRSSRQRQQLPTINLYSSPVHRCQQSAASQLMGLFPTGLYDLNISVATTSPKVLPPFENIQNELEGMQALPYGTSPFSMLIESEVLDVLIVPSEKSCPVGR
eukprot:GABU01004386.1.p1 GENE.GABU01004386.1~~GABU01004386.1.p1  ORF type:complete len:126 (+),score=13.40 GABU01004386.1:23-379(+)